MRSPGTSDSPIQRVCAFKSVIPHAPQPPGSSWVDPVVVVVPERCLSLRVCVCMRSKGGIIPNANNGLGIGAGCDVLWLRYLTQFSLKSLNKESKQ